MNDEIIGATFYKKPPNEDKATFHLTEHSLDYSSIVDITLAPVLHQKQSNEDTITTLY